MAHGRLAPLDLSPALAVPGVVAALGPRDIPGRNDIAQAGRAPEHMLADGLVEYWGQPLAMVVAETRDAALAGAAAVAAVDRAAAAPCSPSRRRWTPAAFLMPPTVLTRGDAPAALAAAPRRLSGTFHAGGQEHFYLEGQIALAVPGEDGDLVVHSSTQHPTEVQHISARILGCDHNRITVRCGAWAAASAARRATPPGSAACAALAAGAPAGRSSCGWARKADIAATGKRHPMLLPLGGRLRRRPAACWRWTRRWRPMAATAWTSRPAWCSAPSPTR